MQSKVSVIMPTYKGSSLIKKPIESVLNQTYKNIELIVVDDNGKGTDEQMATQAIVNEYLKDTRVKYICHRFNKNGSAARNTGIREADGDYIAFLDDDDCFMESKIEEQVELLDALSDEYGLVYGGVTEVFSDGREKTILPRKSDDFLFAYLAGRLYVCSSTILLRRKTVEKTGLWDESFLRHQDMEYMVRVAAEYKVDFINKPCIKKFRIDRSFPQDGKKFELFRLHFLNKMKPYIELYDKEKQQEIYFFHYFAVGKAYLKNKRIKPAVLYAIRSGSPIKMILLYIKDMVKYFIK